MGNNNLYFYEVDDGYVEYMSKYDKKIMYTKMQNRKFKRKYIEYYLKLIITIIFHHYQVIKLNIIK